MKERKTTQDPLDNMTQLHPWPTHWPISSEDLERELRYTPLFSASLFTGILSIYVMTLHPSVSGGDNGELLGCACELGNNIILTY